MPSYERIIVGSDGSQAARDAVAVAGVIAAKLGVAATTVTAWKPSIEVPGAREFAWAQRTTLGADVALDFAGVQDAERIEAKGDPADALMEAAATRPSSLIVVGAHGLDSAASRLFGSTSNQLSHQSEADVVFVRHRLQEFGSVALATDGSETSLTAVMRGYAFATDLGADVSLVTVARSVTAGGQVLEEVQRKLLTRYPDASVELRVRTGNPADELRRVTSEFDLLGIGNRGMAGVARVLGSTANSVTHHSTTNLLLVNTNRKEYGAPIGAD